MPHAILFVHLGEALPPYLDDALAQARLFNGCDILLITNAAALAASPPDPGLRVRSVAVEDLPASPKLAAFRAAATVDRAFRFGFWSYVIERFFHIEAAMAAFGLENVVHLETDNLLYADLDTLIPRLEKLYPGGAVPFDGDRRGIAGILYIRNLAAVARFTRFVAEIFTRNRGVRANDMMLLGLARQRLGASVLDALPVVPAASGPLRSLTGEAAADPSLYARHAEALGTVFDTGAFGQYLGGVDPRNVRGRPTLGFVNESAVFQASRYRFRLAPDQDGRRIPWLCSGGRSWPIANLHVHSKNLAAFRSRPERIAVPPMPRAGIADTAAIPEPEIVTGERLQALADISVIDDWTFASHTGIHAMPDIHLCRFRGPRSHLTVDGPSQIRDLQRAGVIFVYTHLLDSFILNILPHLTQRFVLVSHSSDHRVGSRYRPFMDDVRLVHWFAQNVLVEHPKLTALPIGLANAQWPHGDTRALAEVARLRRPKTGLLYANFDVRTNPPHRGAVREVLARKPFAVMTEPKPYRAYLEELAGFRFCASPLGNGPDCHRTWEALYLGVIPLVQKGAWMRSFEDLPLVAVERWDDVDEAFLEREHDRIQRMPRRFDPLMLSHWRARVRAALAAVAGRPG
ncbi:MAG TPA: hypothetical protein VD978_22695 [Azospirillum sp.]|nr:hypothetical protein [Azospirillum sp.]